MTDFIEGKGMSFVEKKKLHNFTFVLSFLIFVFSVLSLFAGEISNSYFDLILEAVFLVSVNIAFVSGLYYFNICLANEEHHAIQFAELTFTAFANLFIFANLYKAVGINSADGVTHNAVDCLYFSVVTWTTLGYGDFTPTESLRIPAAIEALLGYTFMAILAGLFLSIFIDKPGSTKSS